MTVPDAIGARYRSPAAQGLAAVAMLVGIIGYMATNALAMGVVINSIFGVGLGWGIWIGMGITLAYSVVGRNSRRDLQRRISGNADGDRVGARVSLRSRSSAAGSAKSPARFSRTIRSSSVHGAS